MVYGEKHLGSSNIGSTYSQKFSNFERKDENNTKLMKLKVVASRLKTFIQVS